MPTASSPIFVMKAGFAAYLLACTLKSMAPDAIAKAAPIIALLDRNGPMTLSGTWRKNPSRRKSSGTIAPTSSAIDKMCAALTNR